MSEPKQPRRIPMPDWAKELGIYLQKYHCGEASAITSRELEMTFGRRGNDIRDMVNLLRCSGVPICSGSTGYYYAATEEELTHTIRQLRGRANQITRAERGLTRALQGNFASKPE